MAQVIKKVEQVAASLRTKVFQNNGNAKLIAFRNQNMYTKVPDWPNRSTRSDQENVQQPVETVLDTMEPLETQNTMSTTAKV